MQVYRSHLIYTRLYILIMRLPWRLSYIGSFTHNRVNAVNLRKEFFQVSLDRIAKAVTEIDGEEANFQTTIVAEEYYESKRLREQNESGKGTLIV